MGNTAVVKKATFGHGDNGCGEQQVVMFFNLMTSVVTVTILYSNNVMKAKMKRYSPPE